MTGILANDSYAPFSSYNAAVATDFFHGSLYLHNACMIAPGRLMRNTSSGAVRWRSKTIDDPALTQVVGAQFHLHAVSWKETDAIHPHLS